MFGLSLNDTILVSTFILTSAAAIVGLTRGKEQREAVKAAIPATAVGAGLVSEAAWREMIDCLKDIALGIRQANESQERRDLKRMNELLEKIQEGIDHPHR